MTQVLHLPAGADPDAALVTLDDLEVLDLDLGPDGARLLLADHPELAARVARALGPGVPVSLAPAPRRDGDPIRRFHTPAPVVDGVPIHLGAGVAFGSGAHATTTLCLDWISEAPMPARVLDVGTGTGVLAIAAVRRGAEEVLAVDTDPAAVAEARTNVATNGLSGRIEVRLGGPEGAPRVPLVLANLLPGPLLSLAPALRRVVASRGELLLSGIPAGLVDEIAARYVHDGFRRASHTTRDGWGCVLLRAGW